MSEERLSLVDPDWPEFLFHVQRYTLARRFAEGKRVLDCACGEGYGSSYMATVAANVTGVDIATSAIATCKTRYENQAKLCFDVGDIRSLPFPDASFDVICCFETIEHLKKSDSEVALNELARVLAPDGILFISTPDGDVGRRRNYANPYHLYEMSLAEFQDSLKAKFQHVNVFTQELNLGSVLCPVETRGSSEKFDAMVEQSKLNEDLSLSPQLSNIDYYYLLAVCSNSHVSTPASHAFFSFGREPILSLWNKLDKNLKEHRVILEKVEISESNNKILSKSVLENSNKILQLSTEISDRDNLIVRLQEMCTELNSKLSYMEPFWGSRSARTVRKYFRVYSLPILGPVLSAARKFAGRALRYMSK
ncbi:class I SAM-dependent methyltransferase [Brucella sp. 21LCYQ03]|nr:class I SAM-dependent methyltransferase [Brucella sp. 21LCYQ03]